MIITSGINLRIGRRAQLMGRGGLPARGGVPANSLVTWDAAADTYTQTIYQVDQSKVTWDATADTYTQELYV